MLTRRGGDFFWLVCDACIEAEKLLKWEPGARFGAKLLATEMVKELVASGGWKVSADGTKHACPNCLLRAEEKRARRRHVAV